MSIKSVSKLSARKNLRQHPRKSRSKTLSSNYSINQFTNHSKCQQRTDQRCSKIPSCSATRYHICMVLNNQLRAKCSSINQQSRINCQNCLSFILTVTWPNPRNWSTRCESLILLWHWRKRKSLNCHRLRMFKVLSTRKPRKKILSLPHHVA